MAYSKTIHFCEKAVGVITLHTFGPSFGLPDPSPFVIKAHLLLKLSGLAYEAKAFAGGLNIGPKGKRPFIEDDGETVADSTLIRMHLERKHGKDLDAHLSSRDKGLSWAVEKMCEEHLYFGMMYFRWLYKDNFQKGPAHFFDKVPALVRPLVQSMALRNVKKMLHAQGLGRHSEADLALLIQKDIDALAAILSDREWIGGASACAADASVGAFVISALCETFAGPPLERVKSHPSLVAYAQRVRQQFFS